MWLAVYGGGDHSPKIQQNRMQEEEQALGKR